MKVFNDYQFEGISSTEIDRLRETYEIIYEDITKISENRFINDFHPFSSGLNNFFFLGLPYYEEGRKEDYIHCEFITEICIDSPDGALYLYPEYILEHMINSKIIVVNTYKVIDRKTIYVEYTLKNIKKGGFYEQEN